MAKDDDSKNYKVIAENRRARFDYAIESDLEVGIMLTGMGSDGAAAMRELKDCGSYNYVQDQATSVVFGMPREAIAHGAAHEVLPLKQIGLAMLARLRVNAAPDPGRDESPY